MLETAAYVVGSLQRTKNFDLLRLYILAKRLPGHTDGSIRLSFGPVAFNDIHALKHQYIEIYLERGYEVEDLPPNPRILDCGGNIGLSVLWFKQRYPASVITVFEPDPSIVLILRRNIRQYQMRDVDVVQAAVDGHEGVSLFLPNHDMGGHIASEGEISGEPVYTTLRVPTVRLIEYLNEPIDILKLDIEGSEYDVLLDVCSSGKSSLVRHIICEIHAYYDVQGKLAEVLHALDNAGFHLTIRSGFSIADMVGASKIPFPSVTSGRFHMLLYAWRPAVTE